MRRWGAAVAVLLAAAACSPGAADSGTVSPSAEPSTEPSAEPSTEPSADPLPTVREPAEPVPGMAAEAVQLRTDAAAGGRIQVRISASDTFTVTSVALDSPGFDPLPPSERTADFVPGRVIDLRTPFGRARCDVSPEPAAARLTVVRPGAEPEEVQVPLSAAVLEEIHTDECAEQALAEGVTVQVVDLRDDGGGGLVGSLEMVRRSEEREVRVTALRRSVLMAAEVALPLTLPAAAPEAATAVRFAPATCEPHVLAETKQPFLFPLTVEVGDDEPVTIDLPVPDDLRAQLQALVQRTCE
jgi:hypothetical protein